MQKAGGKGSVSPLSKSTPISHAVQLLSKARAQLVPLKGWYNRALPSNEGAYATWKQPTTSYKTDPNATQKAYTGFREGRWIGFATVQLS